MKEEYKKVFLKMSVNLSVVTLLFFLTLVSTTGEAEGSSVNIKNNVRAKANSGGNTISGSGEINTGDATAKSSVKTNVSGEEINVSAEAEAEANGEKAEVNVESSGEDVNIHEEAGNASAEVNVTNNLQPTTNNEQQDNNDINESEKKSFFAKTVSSIRSGIKSVVNKIITIFS
jgi:hypothetical protein